ncbi:MAG: hypothetical protein L7T62_08305 [Flavobacteriaceae bacterium]|nr:hypothetical protein [Flavobacteriaceae bacterium]
MKGQQLSTIGQVIQWAANKQMDMLQAYERQHGFSSRVDIWAVFSQEVKEEIHIVIEVDSLSEALISRLISYLTHPQSDYHLEMSTDEMAHAFLAFTENS